MNFHEVNLPRSVGVFAIGRPTFSTSIVTTASGKEIRHSDRVSALQTYSLQHCCLSIKEFEEFNSFFRARRGQAFAFRFFDYADHQVMNQYIADGDGVIPIVKNKYTFN